VLIIIINERAIEAERGVNLLTPSTPSSCLIVTLNYQVPFKMKGKEDATSGLSKKSPIDLPVPSSPTECPSPAEVSALLAKEMNQLSVEEREKALEDVHGIARVVDEPHEFIEACLARLEKELINISGKAAYNLASSKSKEYTSSKTRRLMFLRAESFDPYNAAARMVRFFDEKYELFGADKLIKNITLDDLDPDDITTLENGAFQVLPKKDCAGRKVFFIFPKLKVDRTVRNVVSNDICETRCF
jgi:hypothetical protein